jgi:hypothetical protein
MREVVINEPQLYRGLYRAHWELSYFTPEVRKRWWGISSGKERWSLRFPEGYDLPWAEEFGGVPRGRLDRARLFEIEFEGVASAKGAYGHKGYCQREARVLEVVSAREVPPRRG